MSSSRSALFFVALIFVQHIGSYADCNENNNNFQKQRNHNALQVYTKASEKDMFVFGAKTFGVAAAVIVTVPLVVGAAGFGAAGVAGGSLAATIQSVWFGGSLSGWTGTVFAGMQSVGAVGSLGIGAKSAIVAASGVAVKAHEYLSETSGESGNEYCSKKSRDNNKQC